VASEAINEIMKAVEQFLSDGMYGPEKCRLFGKLIDDEKTLAMLFVIDTLRAVDDDDEGLADVLVCFVHEMAEKLLHKAVQGYNGWSAESSSSLRQSIAAHLLKGDPVDVANIAMFWYERQKQFTVIDNDKPDDRLIQDSFAHLRAGGDIETAYRALDARFTVLREELRRLRGQVGG